MIVPRIGHACVWFWCDVRFPRARTWQVLSFQTRTVCDTNFHTSHARLAAINYKYAIKTKGERDPIKIRKTKRVECVRARYTQLEGYHRLLFFSTLKNAEFSSFSANKRGDTLRFYKKVLLYTAVLLIFTKLLSREYRSEDRKIRHTISSFFFFNDAYRTRKKILARARVHLLLLLLSKYHPPRARVEIRKNISRGR